MKQAEKQKENESVKKIRKKTVEPHHRSELPLSEIPLSREALMQASPARQQEIVAYWQQLYGNTAVQHILQPVGETAVSQPPIQPKLVVNQPDDPSEREADAVANQVIAYLNSTNDSQENHRGKDGEGVMKVAGLETEGDQVIQRVEKPPARSQINAPPEIESQIAAAKTSGQPLDNNTRQQLESAFGSDFSRVRIHNDENAKDLNHALQARAFTHQETIWFREGEYNPNTQEGIKLLAHELTHVLQQRQVSSPQKTIRRKEDPPLSLGADESDLDQNDSLTLTEEVSQLVNELIMDFDFFQEGLNLTIQENPDEFYSFMPNLKSIEGSAQTISNSIPPNSLYPTIKVFHLVEEYSKYQNFIDRQVPLRFLVLTNEYLNSIYFKFLLNLHRVKPVIKRQNYLKKINQIPGKHRLYERMAHDYAYNGPPNKKELDYLGYKAGKMIEGDFGFKMICFAPLPLEQLLLQQGFSLDEYVNLFPVVAFRGTDMNDFSEAVVDLLVDLDPRGVGYQQWEVNKKIIQKNLTKLQLQFGKKIVLVGHSLGGALAQITGANFPSLIREIVTFQSPAVNIEQIRRIKTYNKMNKSDKIQSSHHQMASDFVSSVGEVFSPGDVYRYSPGNEANLIDMLSFAPHRRFPVEEITSSDHFEDLVVKVMSAEGLGDKQPLEDIRNKFLLLLPFMMENPALINLLILESYRRQKEWDERLQ